MCSNEIKLQGKGEVVGKVSGVQGGRAREGVALLLSRWLLRCVLEWKQVSSRLMWVRVKIEQELYSGRLWVWKRHMIRSIGMVCGRC